MTNQLSPEAYRIIFQHVSKCLEDHDGHLHLPALVNKVCEQLEIKELLTIVGIAVTVVAIEVAYIQLTSREEIDLKIPYFECDYNA